MTKKDKADGEKKKFGEKAAAQAEEEKDYVKLASLVKFFSN